ncbi:hypothetical protein C8J56DRAFT_1088552 [Mycena floridula]|nr:hypothetical protein C8J56DRAFT_1088552 [Mycena floridula]
MAAMEITVGESTFGNIGGNVLSNNTTIYHTHVHSAPATPGRARGYMPAPSAKLFGRDDDIQEIVRILVRDPVRFALLGAGGQGKTALALKVMAQLAMKGCYSAKNSVWIPCEKATSTELLYNAIYTSLDITKDTHNTIQDILNELRASSDPIILLLDNFETPWNAPGAQEAVARILQDIAELSHVTLFLTMRGRTAPCEEITWVEKRIQTLDPEASLQLFTAIHQQAQGEPKLGELLDKLGHMALAVKLMARHGKNTGYTVEKLISSYSVTGTAMLGRKGSDSHNSVSISIRMSLESSLVKDELNASRLLDIIAMLPSGTTLDTLQQLWALGLENLDPALQALLETSLLECHNMTYFVLPVIRSYLLDPSHLPNDVHHSVVNAACIFLLQHQSGNPGEPSFQDDMKALAIEEVNLQSILLGTSEANPMVIGALHTLAWHQYHVRPRTEVAEHGVKLAGQFGDQLLLGRVLSSYAKILLSLDRCEDCLKQHKLARQAYLAASEPALAAATLLNIVDVSVLIDPSMNEIPLLEESWRELELIHKPPPTHRPWILRLFLRLRNRFKKSASLKVKPSTIPNEQMVRYLRRLGRAHSRKENSSEAIKCLTQARDLSEDPISAAKCAGELSTAYYHLDQFDEAEKWGVLAVAEWKQIGGYNGAALSRLGKIYIKKGEYDKAIDCLEQGLESVKAQADERGTADLLLELGETHLKKGNTGYDDARRFFREALEHYKNLPEMVEDEMFICQLHLDILDNSDSSQVPDVTGQNDDCPIV